MCVPSSLNTVLIFGPRAKIRPLSTRLKEYGIGVCAQYKKNIALAKSDAKVDAVILISDKCDEVQALRRAWQCVPIIMVSNKKEERIAALRTCADEAVASSIDAAELAMRIAVVIRRAGPRTTWGRQGPNVMDRTCHLDEDSLSFVVGKMQMRLTPRQAQVMAVLMRNIKGAPVSLERIHDIVSDHSRGERNREATRAHICILNRRFSKMPELGVWIEHRSGGYVLCSPKARNQRSNIAH